MVVNIAPNPSSVGESVCSMRFTATAFGSDVAFFVFTPALVGSSFAKYITIKSIGMLWFMPANIFITIIIGSALGWILIKITRAPRDLSTAFFGPSEVRCNLGNMLFIIIPTVCKERGSPFGNANVCYNQGMAYSSLSIAIGAIFLWSYVYNIVRFYLWLANNAYKPKPMNLALCTFNHWSALDVVGLVLVMVPYFSVIYDFNSHLNCGGKSSWRSTRVMDTFINNHRDHSDSVHCSANIGNMHRQSCHPFRVGEFRSVVPVYSSAAVGSSPSNTDRYNDPTLWSWGE
ncbi:hypothetical protein EZV62_013842 [Acer yangbiense]|uniref:Uncharacterized protein n=1 Tax=Acer yangbiense TaxID=1000413 RepID=A0A5C7HR23_9ROSI|nr:hypothetical protein EZV62_013842 [Acer yangbiense]